eukprot:2911649-Amphidinium_carterae.1
MDIDSEQDKNGLQRLWPGTVFLLTKMMRCQFQFQSVALCDAMEAKGIPTWVWAVSTLIHQLSGNACMSPLLLVAAIRSCETRTLFQSELLIDFLERENELTTQ